MSDKNWLRRYILRCGVMEQNGFEIGNIDSAKETALHVSFNIEKSDSETSNTAKVQIWNLSDENLRVLDTQDCIVELRAGYYDNLALILVGNITSVDTSSDNADRMTELEVVDGRVELRDTTISCSFNGIVNCQQVYDHISQQMGLPIIYAPDLTYKMLPNGFSFAGTGKSALQKLANCCGHAWTIQNQVIQITWPGRPISAMGYLLNSDTGLIDVPKRVTIGASNSTDESHTGWEVKYFLNGNIGINDIVYLESKKVSGYFRVCKITFEGDNQESDWTCTAQLLEIKADSTK